MGRRHQTLIPLSREHHDGLLLAWRLTRGDLAGRDSELKAKHAAVFYESRLRRHFDAEERVLFPAVRDALGKDATLIDLLCAEHREIASLATAIRSGSHEQTTEFCELLERHIRTEERRLFPLIERSAEPQELAALASGIETALEPRRDVDAPVKAEQDRW
jgi:hemerythrin-like domain-containing protein